MEPLLERLVRAEGFKLAALWYDSPESGLDQGGLIAACRSGQALAHRYGMKFLVSASQNDASQAAEAIAGCSDVLSVRSSDREDTAAAIEQQRRLYQRILAANPRAMLFQDVPTRAALLRQYRGNADLVRGILVEGPGTPAQTGPLLRAIRPRIDLPYAAAPGEGPAMYFFNSLWKTPGWQPREGDYGFTKIRPALKTLEQKVNYVLTELKDIPPEHRKIMVNGLAGADELLRELIQVRRFRIAALDYDLENWELTPEEEKADPVAACKRGQELANRYGLSFVVVPVMPVSGKWGPKIAPFVAAIAPQCKGLQAKSIEEAIERQRKLYCEILRANPRIILYHDLGAAPKGVRQSVEGLLQYYSGVADLVDGIEIWSQDVPEQNAVIGRYIVAVRPPARPGG
jgi:hypothetical protein